MFIEKIKSDGLAHLSYLVSSNGDAAVIDLFLGSLGAWKTEGFSTRDAA